MKKIYILTAVLALLTLSLNAQNSQDATKQVQRVEKSNDTGKAVDVRVHNLTSGAKAAPADAVSVPYYNHMTTDDEFNQLGTYDANGDGQSGSNYGIWGFFYTDNTQTDVIARYTYHSRNAADDYLFIAVPVTLQVGKHYRFSMDVRANGYTERFEVVMFDELTETSITSGTQIIPVTSYNSTTTTRIQSEAFTVNEESYMYFAVHCVSAADQYYLYVDNIAIEADDSDDLLVAISAPESIYSGGTATVTATVTNNGSNAVQNYTVNITANGNVILSQQVTSSLAAGASATYTAQYPTTSANAGQTVNFGAEVVYTDDNPSNNTATTSMYILPTPPPENVAATVDGNNATMTWDAPNIGLVPGTLIWDFEENTDLTEFTIIDSDGDGYNWAWHYNTGSGNYTVHGGNGIAYSESFHNNEDGQTGVILTPDNWMISPEVNLGGTLTFWAAHQASYPENFAVYVCQGSYNSVNDFVKISPDITTNATMTEYTYDLSQYQGQGYFAIRHYNSRDNFILLIDDIALETMVPGEQPVSYNVYLDGQLVGNVNSNTFSYTFNNVSGEHVCAVSAVYPGGYESVAVPTTFSTMPKTDAPTLSMVDNGDGTFTITATATNPNAEVTLTIGDQTQTGTGSASITFTQGANPQTVSASATAIEPEHAESDPATQTFIIPALGKTATPTINVTPGDAAYTITATGVGTVTLVVDGVTYTGEGEVSATVVRSLEDHTVTVTATAQDGDLLPSDPAEQIVNIPALAGSSSTVTGLLRLHLLMVDQMMEQIPDDNSHPDRYNYVLRYEPNGPEGEGVKESSTVYVDIQKADCEVTGYYSLREIDNDTEIGINHDQGITMDVMTADVAYNLSSNNDLLWEYLLQGAENRDPEYQQDYLTKLRKTQNFTYVEMLEGPNKGQEYPNGEHHYLGELKLGSYGTTFMSYAPSVSTWGIERRYFEDDGYDNTYGAPIWKTAVGEVKMSTDEAPIAERQINQWNSVNWDDQGGPASLYILDNIVATAKLPHTEIATVKYEPYMFRVFVESKNGLLRPYTVVPAGDGPYDGEHLAAKDGELTEADMKGPKCVWSGYLNFDEDGEVIGDLPNGVEVTIGSEDGQKTYTYIKNKVDRPDGYDDEGNPLGPWNQDEMNALFGALDALAIDGYNEQGKPIYHQITNDDLNVFVRFYYVVKGMADGWVPGSRGQGDDPAGYGTESPGSTPSPWTSVKEILYHGEIVSQTYYNVQGMMSDKPFDGVNIVVTRFSDGATVVSKEVR